MEGVSVSLLRGLKSWVRFCKVEVKSLIPCASQPAEYFGRTLTTVVDVCADVEITCVR